MSDIKKVLKVAHLASFSGNIGDNANHIGFRHYFNQYVEFDIQFTELEIREFYWKQKKFDDSFVDLVNQYDLLIIGGGNYFELWVDESATGTSIDISPSLFSKIAVPVLFNALGVDRFQGTNNVNLKKFQIFLDTITNNDQYLVSVRNDGAMNTLEKYFGSRYQDNILHVPDGGFFTRIDNYQQPEIVLDSINIGINIAGDMLNTRFNLYDHDNIDYSTYCHEMGEIINQLALEDHRLHFLFFPHIFRDIQAIADILAHINDEYLRRRVRVAPYLVGDTGQSYIFNLYNQCNLIWATRFHANVCPIGLEIPTIGLINYGQIAMLYKELEIEDRGVVTNKKGFSKRLYQLTMKSLKETSIIKARYRSITAGLAERSTIFHKEINQWLKNHYS